MFCKTTARKHVEQQSWQLSESCVGCFSYQVPAQAIDVDYCPVPDKGTVDELPPPLLAGNINDATGVLSNMRSLPAPSGSDPRIDLTEASIAARSADYKRQQALAEQAAAKAESLGARLLLARAKLVQGWALDDQSQLKDAAQAYSKMDGKRSLRSRIRGQALTADGTSASH